MRPPRLENLVLCLGIGFFGRGELPALPFFLPSTAGTWSSITGSSPQTSEWCWVRVPCIRRVPGGPAYSEAGVPDDRGEMNSRTSRRD